MATLAQATSKLWILIKTLGTLSLLLILFPFTLLVVVCLYLWHGISDRFRSAFASNRPGPEISGESRTVLLTGGKMTKALQLARCFRSAGHRVILVETHKYWLSGHRFSRAVDRFYTVPAPEIDLQRYIQGLIRIVQQEQVDIFIPVASPVASWYDSLAKPSLVPHCQVFHFDPEITQRLDDKFAFCEQARLLGLSAPQAFLITDPQQVLDFDFAASSRQYILKSISYDSVHRLDMTRLPCPDMETHVQSLPISKEKPWVMQEFIPGQEYCTHSTVRDGRIRLHGCSESSPFQVNYHHVHHPQIYGWVREFVGQLKLTGQISFDFIVTEKGSVYPIECNPRTHTAITMFHDHPGVAEAYLKPAPDPQSPPIEPLPHSRPTYWLYHELWRLIHIRSMAQLQAWFHRIIAGIDAMFRVNDPLPFLMVHHWQIPLLLIMSLRRLKGWIRIDFNIGKLVELGGD